jgi:hypothetical protein
MRQVIGIGVAIAALAGVVTCAAAADLGAYHRPYAAAQPGCERVWRCGPAGCGWRRVCYRCPDRYSCFSLYGAYGPYGGTGYWGRYTYSGWGTYR